MASLLASKTYAYNVFLSAGKLLSFFVADLLFLCGSWPWPVHGIRNRFRYSPWALLTGLLASFVTLIFWQSSHQVFLDRACIHQENAKLKVCGKPL